jgi:lysophospholipase L1-like esterase
MRLALLALSLGLAATPALAQTPYEPVILPAPGTTVCPGGLCQPEALTPLFEALRATETGERDYPVHLVQFGDSHTAGDRITGKLRADLQARFGNGGRGVLPAGVPYAGYAPLQVEVTATDWVLTPMMLTPRAGYGALGVGLTGTPVPGFGTSPSLRLSFDPGSEVGSIGICGRTGSRLSVAADGRSQVLVVEGWEGWLDCGTAAFAPAAREMVLTDVSGEGPNDLFVKTGRPGVIVSNLGIVSTTLRDLAARDDDIAVVELAFWAPQLIILAYGTNEGFDDGLDPADYERLLRGQIERMRRLSPGSALMILGAPDALRSGESGGCSADGRRRPPPNLAVVRDVQRRVAAEMGVVFWDWRGRMGGDCSADRLATMTEPLMRGDRVHFTSEGADWIGGMLSADLMAAYDTWKGQGE